MGSLHPAIVHIPIGLLLLYSLMEIVLVFIPKKRASLEEGKFIILLCGVLGGIVALSSGESLEHLRGFNRSLVEVHSFFATATVWVFGVLAGAFTVLYLQHWKKLTIIKQKFPFLVGPASWLLRLSKFLTHRYVLFIFAVLGLLLIFTTGALGGAISHGPDADFMTSLVYSFFF